MVFQRNNSPFSEFFYENQPLTVTHEYNFLGNILDNEDNFKRSIQELSIKGLKVLFALKQYMSNFFNVPADLSCKLFDTYHVNMPLSCIYLLRLNASFIRGFILSE
jgi:hypothetical protein